MSDDISQNSVTIWIPQLLDGDPEAAQQIWNRYFERLMKHAAPKVNPAKRRVSDEEDIVVATFFDLFQQAKEGKFPRLYDRQDLWKLLLTISDRKLINKYRHDGAKIRGGDRIISGESGDYSPSKEDGPRGLEQVESPEPTPEFCKMMKESCESLLAELDEPLRKVAVLKLRNYTNPEIAAEMGRSLSAIERWLKKIRAIWRHHDPKNPIEDTPSVA